jgi:hypothetical protein
MYIFEISIGGFIMKSKAIATCFCYWFDIMPWVGNHKMAIEMHIGEMLSKTSHDWRSNRKIGYKMPLFSIKYPSMMSICREVAPTSIISWQSLNRNAKSAESIDGPITHFLSCILDYYYTSMELNKISFIISVKIYGK